MRKTIVMLLAVMCAATVAARGLRVVGDDGLPIAFVCVTDSVGALVGTTDLDGRIEDVKGRNVINLSHVAYNAMTVNLAEVEGDQITMTDVSFGLPEVTVKPKELIYVQTYYRLIFFDNDGPIYFRGGVIDNTVEVATGKISSKVSSLAKGRSGMIRFLLSTIVGRIVDNYASLQQKSDYDIVLEREKKGSLTLTTDSTGRTLIADTICPLGYIETDMDALTRATSFNRYLYKKHVKATKERAKAAKKGKKPKVEEDVDSTETQYYYESYIIDEDGHSNPDDFVMSQLQICNKKNKDLMLVLECYATGRDYVDKKEYKQLLKDNKVEMTIQELLQFEKTHNIPELAPNIRAQIDKLFEKELNKQ